MRWLLVTLILIGLLAAPVAVRAQEPTPQPPTPGGVTDDDVNRVAKQLYCPVCENVPLDVCPTQACAQWRATIREKLEAGWSDQQIKDYFATQYGERVRAEPAARGLGVLVWLLPPIAVAVGAFVVWRFLKQRSARQAAEAATAPAPPADEYVARLEDELRRRK